ncbi:hypothetical protein [Phytoactinopolyspora halotolerans]|uniref:DUF2267 domain-containing protein n=1 Tax=Phytoactinopolyspora halotolerans TaxID=1981512 RepID=A0A6L9SBV7_9ACTN|nr:hypothetical protein [Phytoactinopolyspora halotolerans]NEE02144.1 hypothetical protein [Phytoactinopolyspora halotolerans]
MGPRGNGWNADAADDADSIDGADDIDADDIGDSDDAHHRSGPVKIGLISDPVAAPVELARQLATDLPSELAEHVRRGPWDVQLITERLPLSDARNTAMTTLAEQRMRTHGWDLVVCVTDLVLRAGKQPIVADVSHRRRIIVVSLPAFGGMALRRRVRRVLVRLIAEICDPEVRTVPPEGTARRRGPGLTSRFRRITPEPAEIDARIVASRGGLRLLIGMVRNNRPWRLVLGLTGPLVGAFAFSAFYMINTVTWQLASSMGPFRLLAAVSGSVGIMVVWLIVYHRLWEGSDAPHEQWETALFNVSTLVTLTIGVGCMYVALFLVNLAAAAVVLTGSVLGEYVGADPGLLDYVVVTMLVTAAATVAGAIGSGFESEESIREAAFSYRERERRDMRKSNGAG